METKDIIKKLRTDRGLTLQELSIKLGIQKTNLSELETGKRKVGLLVLTKLADFYKVPLDYIIGREIQEDSTEPSSEINLLPENDIDFLRTAHEQLEKKLNEKEKRIKELEAELDSLKNTNREGD